MTREEALLAAERKQVAHPEAKWIAARQGDEWVVARVDVRPVSAASGASVQPPPIAPRESPQSERQRVIAQYGAGG